MVRNKTMCTLLLLVALIGGAPSASVSAGSAVIMTPQNAAMTLPVTKFTDSADGRCDADCSLREAITVANQAPGADTITLLPGTYQLTIPLPMSGENTEEEDEIGIGDLDIAGELHLRGAGAEATVLTSLINDRVIEVLPEASVRISDLTMTGGQSDHDGGDLFNAGELALTNVKIAANRAGRYEAGGNGGGLYNAGSLLLTTTLVVDNFTSTSGSASASGGGIVNVGQLTMVDGAITLPAAFDPAVIVDAASEPLEALDDEPWFEGPEEAEAALPRLFLPLIMQ